MHPNLVEEPELIHAEPIEPRSRVPGRARPEGLNRVEEEILPGADRRPLVRLRLGIERAGPSPGPPSLPPEYARRRAKCVAAAREFIFNSTAVRRGIRRRDKLFCRLSIFEVDIVTELVSEPDLLKRAHLISEIAAHRKRNGEHPLVPLFAVRIENNVVARYRDGKEIEIGIKSRRSQTWLLDVSEGEDASP